MFAPSATQRGATSQGSAAAVRNDRPRQLPSRQSGAAAIGRAGFAICITAIVALAAPARGNDGPVRSSTDQRPLELLEDGYISSRQCGACHPNSHASWRDSYHRTMTQIASGESVLAPFDGRELTAKGNTYTLEKDGGAFRVSIRDEDDPADLAGAREVVMTTGSHHFQIYWTATGKGREVELFPFAYQILEQRWIQTDHLILSDPRRVRLGSIWNKHCIQCHATGAKPRLLSGSDTRVAEFGIACEACHGPGERHAQLNRDPTRRYGLHLGDGRDPSIVNPARLPHDRSSEICGQCHSVNTFYSREDTQRWSERGYPYRPGDVLAETRDVFHRDSHLGQPGETAFWPDEVVRVNGREYNSILKTPCFQRGELSCLSCHVMHQPADERRPRALWAEDQLAAGMRTNAACVQCHERFASPEALGRHTHHAADSSGSRCYDCHMPHTAYGLQKATRSHQVTSPRVDVELATGRPNACNLCHLDRTLAWTAKHLNTWYGLEQPPLNDAQREISAAILSVLSGDAGRRALIGWHLGWPPAREASGTDWMPPYLAELLIDPYPAVRSIAARSLRTAPGFEDLSFDFEAPVARRSRDREFVLARWRAEAASRRPSFRLLLRRGGALDQTLFDELRQRRNDRFVWLLE